MPAALTKAQLQDVIARDVLREIEINTTAFLTYVSGFHFAKGVTSNQLREAYR